MKLLNAALVDFYFFCHPHGPAERTGYEHPLVVLAEGLSSLGVQCWGNVNYWPEQADSDRYLISHNPEVDFRDCDVVLFSSVIYNYERFELLPPDLFDSRRNYRLLFIDFSVGVITPGFRDEFRAVDIVLKAHYCGRYNYPENFVPWQFGLSRRIISAVKPQQERTNQLLINFRLPHPVRELAARTVYPELEPGLRLDSTTESFDAPSSGSLERHYWELSGRRHYPEYYERLGRSLACAAFGGYLQTWFTQRPGTISQRLNRLLRRIGLYGLFDRVYQFDSWRFWEALASGCATLHVDLEKYGLRLPVMPENGLHYLGVDFSSLSQTQAWQDQSRYSAVGEAGRAWVLKHYSPEAIAVRLLELLRLG